MTATEHPEGWLRRIGYDGPLAPTLGTLRGLVAAHAMSIPFECIDPLLGRPPALDSESLRRKLIEDGRGGYCCEQNMLFRAGLQMLGFQVTSLLARVIHGAAADAPRPATHMVLRVNLPEGPFLADVGFGGMTLTAPLALTPDVLQETPHETAECGRISTACCRSRGRMPTSQWRTGSPPPTPQASSSATSSWRVRDRTGSGARC
jgi:N-hydroxyarylamine O-acetyltransferase